MMREIDFDSLLEQLLLPISSAEPAGRWMRYEPSFSELSRLREEDDPNLPMGDWERPLQKANWATVAEASIQLLEKDSKDFQVAAWLTDAWIRTHSWQGLCTGLQLLNGIAERFWRAAWPALDDDNADRRLAPFIWMNNNLPRTIGLSTVLLPASLQREQALRLVDWDTAPLIDDAKTESKNSSPPRSSRRVLREQVRASDSAFLQSIISHAENASAELKRLTHFLDSQLRDESPSLSKLATAIDNARQAVQALLPPSEAVSLPTPSPTDAAGLAGFTSGTVNPTANLPTTEHLALLDPSAQRAQAYAALTDIAALLKKIEPTSPTPYMIERALALGAMPFPEMITAINASAGSIDRFFELLGISQPKK
jgi:type VI secretion system protein ImpA